MSETAFIIAGQGRSVDRGGTDFTNPGNITTDDGTSATCSLTAGSSSDWIVADTFDLSIIPLNATITGIEGRIEVSMSADDIGSFASVNIGTDDSTLGTPKTGSEHAISSTVANYDFGGPFDLWGMTLDCSALQANTFQVRAYFTNEDPDAATVNVDVMWVKVHYTLPTEKVIFLTATGSLQNWTVPKDWNSARNSIEVIGGGAGGHFGGGAGGAYAAITNVSLTPSATIPYQVGAGGSGALLTFSGTTNSTDGGDTWFGASSFVNALVGARGGARSSSGTGGTGGPASSSIGSTKFSGGDGGNSGGGSNGGGGGGAAAGPHGEGGDGGNGANDGGGGGGAADGGDAGSNASGDTGGSGGANRSGLGAGSLSAPNGSDGGGGRGANQDNVATQGTGSREALWTQTDPASTAGPAGGPGGGWNTSSGLGAINHGGGGSGMGEEASPFSNPRAGDGSPGVIVIRYFPTISTQVHVVG